MATAPPPHRTREALVFRIRTALRLERLPDKIRATASKGILDLIKENMMNWSINRATKDKGQNEVEHQRNCQAEEQEGHHLLAEAVEDKEAEQQNLQAEAEEEHHFEDEAIEDEEAEQQNLQAEADEEHHFEGEAEPVAQEADQEPMLPQHDNVWHTPYSTRPPSPVRCRLVPPAPRLTFEAPPPYAPEDAATDKLIRKRMKSARARRGAMG